MRRRRANWQGSVQHRPEWIGRALSRAGILSPAQAQAAIRAGRVSISGRVVREPLAFLRPQDEVRLDGRAISLAAPTVVIAYHKPAGVVVAHGDQQGKPTVFDLLTASLPPDLANYVWHAVGRLDRDTTGLLLFTNHERLLAHVTMPATHLPKRYLAQVSGVATNERLEPLRRGVMLDDGLARPAKVRLRGPNEVELTITEGRNHQVKRMLGSVGLPVKRLHREAVGTVVLDVAVGQWRLLSQKEIIGGLGFAE